MRWRRWRQDLRLWVRRRGLALSDWTLVALNRRWVQQSLAALGLLLVLSGLHRSQGLVWLGPVDQWLSTAITQPYDFRGAAARLTASPLWRAARVPELVERLRQSLAVPVTVPTSGDTDSGGPVAPALAPADNPGTLRDGDETGLAASLVPPIPGAVTQSFGHAGGQGANTLFQGIELQGHPGLKVRAATAGTVVSSDPEAPGHRLVLDHGGGLRTVYVFSGPTSVAPGEQLERGAALGSLDGQGGYLVYFEVQVDGKAVDPSPFLPEDGGSL
ncbi:MAG: murein hydrolase activator EnvC family protein [Bacillota bacterium]